LQPASGFGNMPLKHDGFRLSRHRALSFCFRMIFSENRRPLFRIMRRVINFAAVEALNNPVTSAKPDLNNDSRDLHKLRQAQRGQLHPMPAL
jgi:hypothetical protein